MNQDNIEPAVISETENFAVWRSEEDEGSLFHVELGAITLHLTSEEWDELVLLVGGAD